jgi:hypothetical protein
MFWFFNATFSNILAISWRPVLVVEEAGVPGENHRPWASLSNIIFFFFNINISDDKVHNFVVNIVDLNQFISLNTIKDSRFILGYFD